MQQKYMLLRVSLFSLIESLIFEQSGRQAATEEPNKGLKTR